MLESSLLCHMVGTTVTLTPFRILVGHLQGESKVKTAVKWNKHLSSFICLSEFWISYPRSTPEDRHQPFPWVMIFLPLSERGPDERGAMATLVSVFFFEACGLSHSMEISFIPWLRCQPSKNPVTCDSWVAVRSVKAPSTRGPYWYFSSSQLSSESFIILTPETATPIVSFHLYVPYAAASNDRLIMLKKR